MKLILIVLTFILPVSAFSAETLVCSAEDGSKLTATVSSIPGSVPVDFRIGIRDGKLKHFPNAYASYIEIDKDSPNKKIKLLVVSDPKEGILVVIKDEEVFIDPTGIYEASCHIDF